MAGYEQTFIVGHVGKPPIMRQGCCEFNVAVNQMRDGREQLPTWYRVVTNEQVAKWCMTLLPGHKISVMGKVRSQAYEKDGRPMSTLVLLADQIIFLEKRTGGGDGFDNGEEPDFDYEDNVPF